MPLTQEQIEKLLALPQGRTGKRKNSGPDTSVRDYQTWFKLATKMVDEDTQELLKCENPDCKDPRGQGIVVSMVNGKYMCRYCFFDGWLLIPEEQETLPNV